MFARRTDLLQIGHQVFGSKVFDLFLQHLAVADNGVQGRAQLVAHVREKGALGLTRLNGLVASLGQLCRAIANLFFEMLGQLAQLLVGKMSLVGLLFGDFFGLLARFALAGESALEYVDFVAHTATRLVSANCTQVSGSVDRVVRSMPTSSPKWAKQP